MKASRAGRHCYFLAPIAPFAFIWHCFALLAPFALTWYFFATFAAVAFIRSLFAPFAAFAFIRDRRIGAAVGPHRIRTVCAVAALSRLVAGRRAGCHGSRDQRRRAPAHRRAASVSPG